MSESNIERRSFSPDELRGIQNWDDLGNLFRAHDVIPQNVGEVLGDGFSLLATADKKTLEGEEFIILDWQFTEGDRGEYVTVRLVTKSGRKLILNDGSTGIRDQMKKYAEVSSQPLYVARGLRRSDYTINVDGKSERATTYYLDTARNA